MITRFETGRFVPQIHFMNPQKQHKKAGNLSTIRTPAWPLVPQVWVSKRMEELPSSNRPRPVLEIYKADPNARD